MRRWIASVIALLCGAVAAYATACPTGYTYVYSLTINTQSSLSGNISSFPMLFEGNSALATVANGGKVQSSTGLDVVWCDAASGGNLLPYELVANTYSTTSGAGEWYILVPTISHTTTVTIYAQVGKASASDQSNAAGTWPSFLGVWHGGGGNSLSLLDSTGTNGSPTNHSAVYVNPAYIDTGFSFAGEYFDTGNILSATQYTVEAWGYFNSFSGGRLHFIASNANSAVTTGFALYAYTSGLSINIANASGSSVCRTTSGISVATWTYVAGTYNGSNATLTSSYGQYINGAPQSCSMVNTAASSMATPTTDMLIAATASDLTDSLNYQDEIRISSVARSADWINATYLSESAPTSFYGAFSLIGGGGASPQPFTTVIY